MSTIPSHSPGDPVVVTLPAELCTTALVAKLKQVLAAHPGTVPVLLHLTADGSVTTRLRIGEGYRVDGSDVLMAELGTLLGPQSARRQLVTA